MAYLDLNAPSGPSAMENSNELDTMSPEERADFELVKKLYEEGVQARKEFDSKWEEWFQWYKGKQENKFEAPGKSMVSVNVIRATIQSILPILTDADPGFAVDPQEPRDYQFADVLGKVCTSIWDRRDCRTTVQSALLDAMIRSAGIIKVPWNWELEDGLGDVDPQAIDPNNLFVPKCAEDFNKNCPWVIEQLYKPLGDVRKKFPGREIKADSGKGDKAVTAKNTTEVSLVSPVDQKSKLPAAPSVQPGDYMMVRVWECWIAADAVDEFEEYFDDKSQAQAWKRKYPRGKLITVLPDQKIHLQGVENPYEDGKQPYVRIVDTRLPRQFWGEGEAEPLQDMQKVLNKTFRTILEYMHLMGNPVWKIPSTSGVDPSRITNQIGMALMYEGERPPERDIPPPLPPYILQFLDHVKAFVDVISGVQDVTQGRKPIGVTAAEAIQTLDEAAQTRIRLKERNLNTGIKQLGELMVSRVMQFYTTPRVIKITGTGSWPEFFEFHVSDAGEGRKSFVAQQYQFDEANRQYLPSNDIMQGEPSKGVFDVVVRSGASMPQRKAQLANLALKLATTPADPNAMIDREELLDKLDWPNKEEVIRRMDEKQAQAAAMMPPPGAPPAPPPAG